MFNHLLYALNKVLSMNKYVYSKQFVSRVSFPKLLFLLYHESEGIHDIIAQVRFGASRKFRTDWSQALPAARPCILGG
jgi:hypothetical protein